MRVLAVAAAVVALAGCSTLGGVFRPAATLLDRADSTAAEGRYADALRVYDEWLTKYPAHAAARRARMSRDTIAAMLTAQQEVVRLTRQLEELGRVRTDLTARETELARLRGEVDRLRADLENLKKIDLQMERRRR